MSSLARADDFSLSPGAQDRSLGTNVSLAPPGFVQMTQSSDANGFCLPLGSSIAISVPLKSGDGMAIVRQRLPFDLTRLDIVLLV